ncbi:hypothetical protein HYALB_00011209 [Hymenoscyphus albidus]|uniref:Uncharacterized protein n=1 Tax=Hymenoscyphus albidus TaxID=595503 RepID=A0A9N9LL41_9HELO|nr:hypothetical protein HYALB_00011209 [Hymenoscyphus albidus]
MKDLNPPVFNVFEDHKSEPRTLDVEVRKKGQDANETIYKKESKAFQVHEVKLEVWNHSEEQPDKRKHGGS